MLYVSLPIHPISIITWRAFDLHNWSTKLLYMVKIGHFVTQMSHKCHTLFELNGHFQYLVLFGLLNIVFVLAWTTHFGNGPSLDYSLWQSHVITSIQEYSIGYLMGFCDVTCPISFFFFFSTPLFGCYICSPLSFPLFVCYIHSFLSFQEI